MQRSKMPTLAAKRFFHIELIKPSHYDDDGYVIQWIKSYIPSNSLASVYGLTRAYIQNKVLGDDLDIRVEAYDETNTVLPIRGIINKLKSSGGPSLVCLIGVQSNQFPRAMDIARRFRAEGIQVAIGGFHISGCIAMLPELPPDIQEAADLGVSLFAGEAEGRLADFYNDAINARMQPIYNFMNDLPEMSNQPTPFLPAEHIRKYGSSRGCFDAGRGCPFTCSFCTIINVQGRKSRYRSPDDVEALIRENAGQGVKRFFITDDNFARNKNWESIFDRIIQLKEEQGFKLSFLIQVDTLCHKIPNFIDKAARAGCKQVFIGLENINPDNLKHARKGQNKITEYRAMLQAWRNAGVFTYCGYILGFPGDTPQSIERDIEIIKRELPVDILEFFILTPLPGSQDHQTLYNKNVWMDPDMNKYDLEHVTTPHPIMTAKELQDVYWRAWDLYYTPEHVETLFKRALATGMQSTKLIWLVLSFHGSVSFDRVHPLQSGLFRRKLRTQRRPGLSTVNPMLFYPRRALEVLTTIWRYYRYLKHLRALNSRLIADPATRSYTDVAIQPQSDTDVEALDMFSATSGGDKAVAKARRLAGILKDVKQGHDKPAPVASSLPV